MPAPNQTFEFSTKYGFDSKTLPGVKVTIRRLSEMQRARRDSKVAAHQIRLLEIDELIREKIQPFTEHSEFKIEIGLQSVGEPDGDKCILTLSRAQAVMFRDRLPSAVAVPEMPRDVAVELARLQAEKARILAEFMRPANLRAGLLSIEGPLTYDGKPATVELLLENGPDELIEEISDAVDQHGGLSVQQQKNSSSPSDSGAPVVEAAASMIAEIV